MPLPRASAVVVGRYAGTVEVLAGILQGADIEVPSAAALDAGGPGAVQRVLVGRGTAVVVVTIGPADATLALVLAAGSRRVVGVTWHPPDERSAAPPRGDATVAAQGGDIVLAGVVTAGHIHRDLAAAVRAAAET